VGERSPLLSICIPTYNRAELLRSALWALAPQVRLAGSQVEVVISDNCSPDHTMSVVAWAQQHMPVRYHRNDQNIGGNANILLVANELAYGEFCWILGDDDLAREGAVSAVLESLRLHPDLDYVFVNHSYESTSERQKRPALATGAEYPLLHDLLCSEKANHVVDRWENIISFSGTPALFTSIVSHVFRRSKWLDAGTASAIKTDVERPAGTLQDTFPHACVIARMMVGRPAFYIGFPHVILFVGAQEWIGLWPMMQVVRTLELSDLFDQLGARREMVDLYRNVVFRTSSQKFWKLLTNPSQPGREYFSLRSLVARYWRYPEFWQMVGGVPRSGWRSYRFWRTVGNVPRARCRAVARRLLRLAHPQQSGEEAKGWKNKHG
jgi:glycosyltransferase involved in cell wall biosynthesis